jgi:stage IV sporulation protein FB
MEKDRWDIGRIAGIPTSMHWTVLVTALWILFWLRDVVSTLIAVPMLIALFVAHEMGHVVVARRKRVKVYDIVLQGLHGRTGHDTASRRDEVAIAWGGVGAQLLLLVVGLLVTFFVMPLVPAGVARYVTPVLFVLVDLNIFFAVLALLPIGPFDGHAAWGVIGLAKGWWARRGKSKPKPKPLSPTRQRELDKQSQAEVVDLLDRIKKKSGREASGDTTGGDNRSEGKDKLH